MIVRLTHRLTTAAVAKLNADFPDLLAQGHIVQTTALPEEANEPELASLPRLVLQPHQRNYGRLRVFLDAINAAEVDLGPTTATPKCFC
jgi:hypothetical protein